MKSLYKSRKLALGLFGLWGISTLSAMPVFAGECAVSDAASLESCKDKEVAASGPPADMFAVPEHFMLFDPSFSGGSELQGYMTVGDTPVILHTAEEVQCVDKIEVTGTLSQQEQEGKKAWVIKVTKFTCL
jgi:hypothetical protein